MAKLFTKANKNRGRNRRTTNKALSGCPQRQGHATQNVFHTGDGYRIAQRLVPGGIGRAGNIRPAVREALEPFTFQRGQAADEKSSFFYTLLSAHMLVVGIVLIAAGQRAGDLMVDEVGGVLVLSGALGAGHAVALEDVHPLAAEYRMAVSGGQRIGDLLLTAKPIPAVLRLPADCFHSCRLQR